MAELINSLMQERESPETKRTKRIVKHAIFDTPPMGVEELIFAYLIYKTSCLWRV